MFLDAVNQFTSDGGDESTEPIATFDSVAVLAPRGRFTIELYNSFLKLAGPVNTFLSFFHLAACSSHPIHHTQPSVG